MKVKICGVTTLADALMCAGAGADLIGLNFYRQGKRYIPPEVAREIAAALRALPRPPTLIGVFVNAAMSEMQTILDECSLDLAQLSGDEPDEVLQAMGARGFKAIRRHYLPITNNQLLLFDAHAAGQYGGTGQTADWNAAATIARQCRLLLAGGLTPENVAEAIRRVQPWGVDVASGVESAPGVKEKAKVIAFINAAKQHDPISNL
jgi:phosphoribosylanthranilate isomerase